MLSGVNPKELAKAGELAKVFEHVPRELPTRFVLCDDDALIFLTEEKSNFTKRASFLYPL